MPDMIERVMRELPEETMRERYRRIARAIWIHDQRFNSQCFDRRATLDRNLMRYEWRSHRASSTLTVADLRRIANKLKQLDGGRRECAEHV